MYIDTHAHLYKEYYDDIKDILIESNNLGVNKVISAGVDNKSNIEMINLSKQYNNVFITLGIHPEYEKEYEEDNLLFIEENLKLSKVVAIGEIGLDYHYENLDKNNQKYIFENQLKLAEKYNFPVLIHSRDATEDTLNILKKYNIKGVIHSFSGSLETAREYIRMGYKIGVGGVVTFKNCHIKEVIKEIGIENIVLETDSPYLTPMPFRGKKNIPGNVKYVVDFLSDYLNISPEKISEITNKNVIEIFPKII